VRREGGGGERERRSIFLMGIEVEQRGPTLLWSSRAVCLCRAPCRCTMQVPLHSVGSTLLSRNQKRGGETMATTEEIGT
jgi:hypothetical protein